MFRAPLDSFFDHGVPPFVGQLLSEESLRRTGYFDVAAVQHWRGLVQQRRLSVRQRASVEMGLVGVVSTQLWHHTFIDASLSELPAWSPKQPPRCALREMNRARPAAHVSGALGEPRRFPARFRSSLARAHRASPTGMAASITP